MSQQCGNCKWWDRERAANHDQNGLIKLAASCLAPVPDSIVWGKAKSIMIFDEGENCQVYEELNRCSQE